MKPAPVGAGSARQAGGRCAGGSAAKRYLFSLPMKHHWKESGGLTLIKRSARELRALWAQAGSGNAPPPQVLVPRPGCSNGGLDYASVRPVLAELLPGGAFRVITYAPSPVRA